MAAPTVTARSTPTGIVMDDGYSTVLAFARDPDVSLWEKTVRPPGLDGGDAIDCTTMHCTTWRILRARALITLTESSMVCAYDPMIYDQALLLINVEGAITVHFPDGSTLAFFGFMRRLDPQDNSEGAQPEASVIIQPTNYDPVNRVEAGPVMTEVTGT